MNEKFSDERISAYLDDELSPDARAEVERELADSADLRQAVEELRALRVGLQSLPRYRLETSIAERVLQLAEREVLLGAGTDDKPGAIPPAAIPPDTIPMSGRATPSAAGGTRSTFDGPQPASLHANAPSYSSASSASSPREGRFSWRTLGWSAAAAVMAALVTNYYHTANLPIDRAADRVAMSEPEAKSAPQAARKDAGQAASDGAAIARSQSRQDEEDAAALSKSVAADAPAADVETIHPPQSAVAGADAMADGPTADALAGDTRARSVGRGGLETGKPDPDAGLDAASAGRAAGAGRGFARESAKDAAMNAAFAGSEAAAGEGGAEGETSIVYLEVSPEAWQTREFDKLLKANHVVLVDEAEAAAADIADGAGGAIEQRSAQDKPNESAIAQAAPRGERPGANSATRRAKAAAPESDVLVVDLTAEQLDQLLADVERRRGDFAVKTAFDVAMLRSEFAAGGMALGGGNAPAPPAAIEEAPAEAEGNLESLRPTAPPTAAPSITRKALDATDPAGVAKGEPRVAPRPRDFGSRGGPERKTDRAADAAPGVADAPSAAAPADKAPAANAAVPDAVMPEEKSPPPAAPRNVAAPPSADKGRRRATGGQARSAEPRSIEGNRENKEGEDKPSRAAAVDAPQATEPGDAPVEAPKESESPTEARPEREDVRIPPEGYARRVSPRAPRAAGTLRQGQADRSRTALPQAPGDAAAPAPSAPRTRSQLDEEDAGKGLEGLAPNRKEQPEVRSGVAGAAKSTAAPRVRVYFLLRPAERGPASAHLAAPADANAPAPPPADSAPAVPEAPATPANPQ